MRKQKRELLYDVWSQMRQRCENPKNVAYARYGGRGITVCERWQTYENFKADIGSRPPGDMSVERIDNDGDYEPSNCRWATRLEQNSNKRNCIYIVELDGERITLSEACRRRGFCYRAVVKRVKQYGWPMDLAIHLEVGHPKRWKAEVIQLWNEYKALKAELDELKAKYQPVAEAAE